MGESKNTIKNTSPMKIPIIRSKSVIAVNKTVPWVIIYLQYNTGTVRSSNILLHNESRGSDSNHSFLNFATKNPFVQL